jgi:hypothetical protein
MTVCLLGGALLGPVAAEANNYDRLGHGRLLTNDLLGDGDDRWRTGSAAASFVWSRDWDGHAPGRAGDLLELRLNAEIIAPENLRRPARGDRPLANALSFGLHTHFTARQTEIALGGDLVVTGSQTGLTDVQRTLHNLVDGTDPSLQVRRTQIGNNVFPTAVAEIGREYALAGSVRLRPFIEGRIGAETLLRVGADMVSGSRGEGGLMVREPVSGQRYRTVPGEGLGLSFVLGADIAHVEHSEFLPKSRGYRLSDARKRVRAGAHWQGEGGTELFYGLTWLGKEFEAQRESQVVGSVRLGIKF